MQQQIGLNGYQRPFLVAEKKPLRHIGFRSSRGGMYMEREDSALSLDCDDSLDSDGVLLQEHFAPQCKGLGFSP